jgi:hypothetical protein
MQQADFRTAFERVQISDLPKLLVHETIPLGVLHAAGLEGPIHSLYHPLLSYEAGRGFFVGMPSDLPFTGHGAAAEIGAQNSLLVRYLARYEGAVPEPIWEEMTWRACNYQIPGCGALAAAWSRLPPASESFPKLVAKLRQEEGPLFLDRLRSFLEPASAAAPASVRRVAPATALAMTRLYTAHYAHCAPFEPRALLDLWQRCEGNAELCRRGKRSAQRLLAGDGVPDAKQWRLPDEGDVRGAADPAPGAVAKPAWEEDPP